MWMRAGGGGNSCHSAGCRIKSSDARTQRVIKPDRATTIRTDTGNVCAWARSGSPRWCSRWTGTDIYRHREIPIFVLARNVFANLARKSFAIPDIARLIGGNQVWVRGGDSVLCDT